MEQNYKALLNIIHSLRDLPPLAFRLVLAYGFYGPAIKKLRNFGGIVDWFGSLGIPYPYLNAIMATATENLGYVLLFLGLGTRLISVPLMAVMVVAIATVHYKNGFECGQNGFEIPFYYMLMLFSLFVTGAGKWSLDELLAKKYLNT